MIVRRFWSSKLLATCWTPASVMKLLDETALTLNELLNDATMLAAWELALATSVACRNSTRTSPVPLAADMIPGTS